ncbi:UPF0146 family protein [Halosegnis sp.]|uniref:UPF0146 family protein n=1 Tax=Halosegnis sp. TaxID=2864959 RepID=UPI0035D4DF61
MSSPRTLADALAARAPARAVEVGIGERPGVAATLAERGTTVTATDIVDRSVPADVTFVLDDITDPTPAVYRGADLIYALNCPPELQRPLTATADRVGAAWAFTTLGADPAVISANPRTLPKGTLFTRPARNGPVG